MENKEITIEFLEKLVDTLIIQEGNFNSYSNLFIYDNEVYKIYFDKLDLAMQNIKIIKALNNHKSELKNIQEIVLPNKLLTHNENIVGFTMPYINGIQLEQLLNDKNVDKNTIKHFFLELLNIINKTKKLSFQFSFYDLHEKNVIIDKKGKINIIDCDGFSIENIQINNNNDTLYGKYLNNLYTTKDINCIDYISLLSMILNYILKSNNSYHYSPIEYLKDRNITNKHLKDLLERVKHNNFILYEEDINNLFKLKAKDLKINNTVLSRILVKKELKKLESKIKEF